MPDLPPAREQGLAYRIALVCLGNICRSPMAEVVLSAKLADRGLTERVQVDSAGTGDWHVGEPMDERAATTLDAHGYDPTLHRARQFSVDWHRGHDLVLVMDRSNLRAVQATAPDEDSRSRVYLFREFDPAAAGELEVADPWYGGASGFEDVLAVLERTTDVLVASLASVGAPHGRD